MLLLQQNLQSANKSAALTGLAITSSAGAGGGTGSAPVLVQNATGKFATSGTSIVSNALASTTTLNNYLVAVAFSVSSLSSATCTDTQGNTYTRVKTVGTITSPAGDVVFFVAPVTTAGASNKATVAGIANGESAIVLMELSGVSSGTLDGSNSFIAAGGSAVTVAVTNTLPGYLIVAGSSADVSTIGAGPPGVYGGGQTNFYNFTGINNLMGTVEGISVASTGAHAPGVNIPDTTPNSVGYAAVSIPGTAGSAASLTPSISYSQSLTTQLATVSQSSVGSAPGLKTQLITSQQGTVAVASQAINVPLSTTTLSAAFAQGAIPAAITALLSGQSSTATVGAVGVGPGLASQQASVLQGSVSAQQSILGSGATIQQGTTSANPTNALIGQQASTQPGQLHETDATLPLGQQATISVGSVSAAPASILTGSSSTGSPGSVSGNQRIGGSQASTQAGAISGFSSQTATGQQTSLVQGTVVDGDTILPSSQVLSTAIGSVSPSTSETASGQSITSSGGSISMTRPITGQSMTGLSGSPVATESFSITGVSASTVEGSTGTFSGSGIVGSSIAATQGSTTFLPTLVGVSSTLQGTQPTATIVQSITGQSLGSAIGTIVDGDTILLASGVVSTTSGNTSTVQSNSLNGLSVSAIDGQVFPYQAVLQTLTGSASNFSSGVVNTSNVSLVSGSVTATVIGLVEPVVGGITSGQSTNTGIGSLTAAKNSFQTGQSISMSSGTTSGNVAAGLGGLESVASDGVIPDPSKIYLTGLVVHTNLGEALFEVTVDSNGQEIGTTPGTVTTHEEIYKPEIVLGGSESSAMDIRESLKKKWQDAQKERLLEQAEYEDQLLLATIKSTISNPKYDF